MTLRASIAAARVRGTPEPEPEPGPGPAAGLAVFEYRFDPADPVFAGHFPARPVLPGVFQLEMTRLAAEETIGCPLVIEEVGKAKFLRIISPGETLRLELKWSEAGAQIRVRARFSVGGQAAGETVLQLSRRA